MKLLKGQNAQATVIPNKFIHNYMTAANGEFVKVYLYLSMVLQSEADHLTLSDIADALNQTESDVARAIGYWVKAGLLSVSGPTGPDGNPLKKDGHFTEPESIMLADPDLVRQERSAGNQVQNNQALADLSDADQTIFQEKAVHRPDAYTKVDSSTGALVSFEAEKQRREYTPEEMSKFNSDEDFKNILWLTERYLGKPLTAKDVRTLAFCYDALHFPADLIEYLVCYCVERNKTSMRYMEKIAINWADKGITTVKAAKEESETHEDAVHIVMSAFGLNNRAPGTVEMDFINKWSKSYGFSSEIIAEACNRALKTTHQPSFQYADSILVKWKSQNVATLQDIKRIDEEYRMMMAELSAGDSAKKKATQQPSSSSFGNFNQRETDLDSLESSLLSNNG